jgi:hypothetical protein
MLGGMLIFRVVAAAHVAALHAEPQVNPLVAHREALLASVRVRPHMPIDLRHVRTPRLFLFFHIPRHEANL